jgi:hypothetical protein
MKSLFIPIFSLFLIHPVIGKSKFVQTSDAYKIDSVFNVNMSRLELYLKDRSMDSSGRSMQSVFILEVMTGIRTNAKITYFGKVGYTEDDLKKWKAWYSQNKDRLVWDEKYKMVWRKN